MSSLLSSTIFRKVAMALSGLFLMVFLLQHFVINITSVFSATIFNQFSHFMGTNFLVQFLLQPILIGGVIFHFVLGFVLELQNSSARRSKYAVFNGNANSSWVSRNMIISGATVLAFLGLHFSTIFGCLKSIINTSNFYLKTPTDTKKSWYINLKIWDVSLSTLSHSSFYRSTYCTVLPRLSSLWVLTINTPQP